MCGIIGILGTRDVAPRLVESLRRLEYRGYDSAGVSTIVDGHFDRRRAEGKLVNLDRELQALPLPGLSGIGHTRWATHGAPTVANAHPHATDHVALVHNGIIENFKALRDELQAEGRHFESETDTEVVAHLISREVETGAEPAQAVAKVLKRLRGAFALAILFRSQPDLLIGARRGSPLVIGEGNGEMFLGSDALGLAPFTQRIVYLEEGDWCVLTRAGYRIFDADDAPVERPVTLSGVSGAATEKGNHRHFMQKEMHEQPGVVGDTLFQYLDPIVEAVRLPESQVDLAHVKSLTIIGCGSAYYAGLVGEYWIEQIARLPVSVDVASEYRYRQPVLEKDGLVLVISQSGETADTLAALRHAREGGLAVAGIINVPTSSMAREVDLLLPTYAGPEIGVASTKAFTCQLAVLASLAVGLARARGAIDPAREGELVRALEALPAALTAALALDDDLHQLAEKLHTARDVLYLGRGTEYPIALEGALKLKEISYIHAEGYAAGEMKHGPIALIDAAVPVITIAPSGPLFEKTVSNMEEVRARKGQVVLLSDAAGIAEAGGNCFATITLPDCPALIAPIVYTVAVQLLAYHIAVRKGTDVDQPRNLAKAVTVE